MQLNATKTPEMLIDFCRNPTVTANTFINEIDVETISQYKYLGTILHDKMTFGASTDSICKKARVCFS